MPGLKTNSQLLWSSCRVTHFCKWYFKERGKMYSKRRDSRIQKTGTFLTFADPPSWHIFAKVYDHLFILCTSFLRNSNLHHRGRFSQLCGHPSCDYVTWGCGSLEVYNMIKWSQTFLTKCHMRGIGKDQKSVPLWNFSCNTPSSFEILFAEMYYCALWLYKKGLTKWSTFINFTQWFPCEVKNLLILPYIVLWFSQ